LDEFHRDQEARADIAASPSTPAPKPETPVAAAIPYDSFDGIYQAAPANQPRAVYTILKVIEMLNSPHLSGMGPEAKRGSLLMALAAVGAETTDILHDAMLRQRALNEYEEAQQRKLAAFEAAKAEENRTIQAELEQIKSEFVTRIQANISQVASCQDAFRIWQKTKQKELNAIADAATYCAPAESRTDNRTEGRAETMASVFDHAAAGRM
jgi:hypothetical protein